VPVMAAILGFIPTLERRFSMAMRSGSAAKVVPNPATKADDLSKVHHFSSLRPTNPLRCNSACGLTFAVAHVCGNSVKALARDVCGSISDPKRKLACCRKPTFEVCTNISAKATDRHFITLYLHVCCPPRIFGFERLNAVLGERATLSHHAVQGKKR